MLYSFSKYIENCRILNKLVVQPRMGFGRINEMQNGLKAVKFATAATIGTITLDSYTRVNRYDKAKLALDTGGELNGYPIVTHGAEKTRKMLEELVDDNFVVQVRHGTALPFRVFQSIIDSGVTATEGGPISYCLPYSRVSLEDSIDNWRQSCHLFADASKKKFPNHIESFAGCMLGQLCPPSLLIALGILECLFFKQNGIKSVSLCYAQGTNSIQDISALKVLRDLAFQYLKEINWHTVLYTYMGVFPLTESGANDLIIESARVAKISGCERLIVKTKAEAYRIPTIEENVEALELCHTSTQNLNAYKYELDEYEYEIIYNEAKSIVETVINLNKNLDAALVAAFKIGILDVPYCLHHQNLRKTYTYIDHKGYLKWANTGNLPFGKLFCRQTPVTSSELLRMLNYTRNKYDSSYLDMQNQ